MLAALSLHYSAVAAIAAVSGAWFIKMVAGRRPAREYGEHFLLHLPHLMLGVALYYFHLSRISESRREWVEGYLNLGFARSVPELLHKLDPLAAFLCHPAVAAPAGLLCLIGCYVWGKSRRDAL